MSMSTSVPSLSLEGEVAIITGGGTGIGRSIALEFAKAGANVVVGSRRLAPLEEVAQEIKDLGKHCLVVQTDVTRKTDVDNLLQRATNEFGYIDILVNNAAHSGSGPSLLDSDEDHWDKIIDTNLKSVYLCCKTVARGMIERKKGNIINISSIDGLRPAGSCRIYGIAKAAVIFLTRGLAWDLAPYNIRVNSIAPGEIETDMISEIWKDPERLKEVESRILLGQIGKPVDIGSVAVFLASDASNYITAQTIVVDGGTTA